MYLWSSSITLAYRLGWANKVRALNNLGRVGKVEKLFSKSRCGLRLVAEGVPKRWFQKEGDKQ